MIRYLGLDFDPAALHAFSDVPLAGRMGDPTGRYIHTTLSTAPVSKWRSVLANPIRRQWGRRYLEFLGAERLRVMGYDQAALLGELDAQPFRTDAILGDFLSVVEDVIREPVRARNRRNTIGGPS